MNPRERQAGGRQSFAKTPHHGFEILAGESHLPRGRAALEMEIESVDPRPSQRSPNAEIPPELDAVCTAALASKPEDRPSARELAARIEKYLDGDRDLALRKSVAQTHVAAARAATSSRGSKSTATSGRR